jgi:hypothetical protein
MKATLGQDLSRPAGISRSQSGWTAGRILALLGGSVLVLCSLVLIGGGGYLLAEATSDGGWVDLGHGTYRTDSYAVVTEPADWSSQTYVLGDVDKVRVRVTPTDATTPVFVGMAQPDAVERYLNAVQHVTVHGASNYQVTYAQHEGQAPSAPPAQAIPWTEQASGTGVQTLEFDAQAPRGDQVLVVMNADGSPSVSGKAESLVTQPSLPWIAIGLLAGGIVLAGGAALLIIKPLRRVKARS